MKVKNKNVLVYGLGDSGRAVINLLRKHKAHVSFYDDNLAFREYVGFEREPQKKGYDFVVVSPGIKCKGNSLLENFKERNIPIFSELDIAYFFSKGKIVAITGTNGKTTVSMLTNKILREAGYKTFLCGNIGLPFSAVCEETTKDSVTVCEVSNFQLETTNFFHPNIACILNLKPDHLDRHGSFGEYVEVKSKIAKNMNFRDTLILNFDDEITKMLKIHKKIEFFSKKMLKKGVFLWKSAIFVKKKNVLDVEDIPLKGEKNLENVLASVAICSHFKVSENAIFNAVTNFTPASHRMEILGEINGVTFVDDSKATNVASTIACVEAFENKPIFLLLGGHGKDINYDDFFSLKFCIKKVVCFGEENEKIFASAKKFGYDAVKFEKFDDAVLWSVNNCEYGDFCILSPACSSFDEFSSYAERGERFKGLVLGL